MVMVKVLNLYAGIGGNRKLWEDVDVTAVEMDEDIAGIYKDYFPNDDVVVGDAHKYLLEHFKEYDFIWASPPCPTHSGARNALVGVANLPGGEIQHNYVYPDMKLYQEIILLKSHFKGKYCIENVIPYYKPLIDPQYRERHCFWTNFYIHEISKDTHKHDMNPAKGLAMMGYDLSKYKGIDKRKIMRNCVLPEVGLHIYKCAYGNIQTELF